METIKLIMSILATILFGWFVINWMWYGVTIIIGPEDKPLIKFWTNGLKQFFKPKTKQ